MSGIRKADIPDVKAIVALGYELKDQSIYKDIKTDEQKFRMTIASLIGHKRGIVLVVVDDDDVPQGFLAGVIEEYGFSVYRYATDMWTYIRKPFRQYSYRLYNQFITWAKTKPKVVFIEMAQSSGIGDHERWCKLMEKLGFIRNGSFYIMGV